MERSIREALEFLGNGDQLLGVDAFRFQGDPNFVIAIRFWFRQDRVTFLAMPEEDRVAASLRPVAIEDEGTWVDLSTQPGWSECVGSMVSWAWAMTNCNGYTDAIRIEFKLPHDRGSRVVEFVVMASAFRFFEAREF